MVIFIWGAYPLLFQFSSVAQLYLTLCNPMEGNMPGLFVHHQLPESTQTHVHWVGDAIQPLHPLSSPSPPTFNISQHQGLFQCQFFASSGQSIGVSASASVLPMNIQGWFPLGWTGWISFQSRGLSRVFSNTTVQKHQFFGAHCISSLSFSEGQVLWERGLFVQQFKLCYPKLGEPLPRSKNKRYFLYFVNCIKYHLKSQLLLLSRFSRVWVCATPQTAAH